MEFRKYEKTDLYFDILCKDLTKTGKSNCGIVLEKVIDYW